jgi:hypothetical protein
LTLENTQHHSTIKCHTIGLQLNAVSVVPVCVDS